MTAIERFEAKVDRRRGLGPHGDCHEWAAARNRLGYGRFYLAGRVEKAHRVAWFLETGEWPDPYALHRCDNPPCVRFDHLFVGTQADNIHDMIRKGRWFRAHGERNGSAKLTVEQVAEIRALRGAMTQRAIAAIYGVSCSRVADIQTGKAWRG